jgi:DNA-binding transcriptional MerR regulator
VIEEVLRIGDVSRLTGIPVNTLRYYRSQKIGPKSTKFGRTIVYREADVRAWMDAQFAKAVGE